MQMYQICLLGGPNYAQWLKCIATVYSVLRTDRPKTGSCSKKCKMCIFAKKCQHTHKVGTHRDPLFTIFGHLACVFYIKNGFSFITSKSLSNNLSNSRELAF